MLKRIELNMLNRSVLRHVNCFYKALKIFIVVVFQSHSCVQLFRPHGLQRARPPCPLPSSGVCPSSCPLYQWCPLILWRPLLLLPSIFLSIRDFSNESRFSYQVAKGASASVLPMNIQGWFPLGLDFPCGSAGKESTCSRGDLGLIPEFGRSPGKGKGYPL